jgi:hypothetical protein
MAKTPTHMTLDISAQFGKTAFAAQIQEFVGAAVADAFDQGVAAAIEIAGDFMDPDSLVYFDEIVNPFAESNE